MSGTISTGDDGTPVINEGDLGPQGGKITLPKGEALEKFKSLMEHMGVEPDGTVPPLVPELQGCVVEREVGLMINHPYIHEFYLAMENGRYNKVFEKKRELIEKHRAKEEWNLIFMLGYVERPYALTYLIKWADEMPDEAYWETAGDIWTDSENIWQHQKEWREVLTSDRPGREHMRDEEYAPEDGPTFEALPDIIKVYRGTSQPDGDLGLSWTLNRDTALMFAKRWCIPPNKPRLIAGRVRKQNVLAYFNRRAEQEIVCFPEHVFDKSMEKV